MFFSALRRLTIDGRSSGWMPCTPFIDSIAARIGAA